MPVKPPSDTDAGKAQMTIPHVHAKHRDRWKSTTRALSSPSAQFYSRTGISNHTRPQQFTFHPKQGRGNVYGEMCDPHPPFSLRLCAFSPACIPFSEPLRLPGDKTNDAILGVIFCCPPCRCLSPLCDGHSRQRPPSSHPPTTFSSAPSSSSAGSDGPEEEGHNK